MGSAMLMGERVQRRESCDARSEVGAWYLYKTVMCEKSSVCSWANVAVPCGAVRGQRAERVRQVTVERTEPIRRAKDAHRRDP